jgi:hypothetical protein
LIGFLQRGPRFRADARIVITRKKSFWRAHLFRWVGYFTPHGRTGGAAPQPGP